MMGKNRLNLTFSLLLAAALWAGGCAPVRDPLNDPTSTVPEIKDDGSSDGRGTLESDETEKQGLAAAITPECPHGQELRRHHFPLLRMTQAELDQIAKQVPLDTESYPLTTPGIGNNKYGHKDIPFSLHNQIAYKVDLRRYSPTTVPDAIKSLELEIPSIRKYRTKKKEFMCILENQFCSGRISSKARKHLNPEWKTEPYDRSFSDGFFNQIGTWPGISLSKSGFVYTKRNFRAVVERQKNKLNDKPFLNSDVLAKGKMTLVLGTQTYFEPENAFLNISLSYCRE